MRQVTAAVIIEDGLLFLARRAPGERLAGMWELPGGKMEPGETPQECLQRELLEELAMEAVAGEVLASTTFSYAHGRFEMLAVAAERRSDYCPAVHDDTLWVSRRDLERLSVAPADIELIAELQRQGIW